MHNILVHHLNDIVEKSETRYENPRTKLQAKSGLRIFIGHQEHAELDIMYFFAILPRCRFVNDEKKSR